MTTTLIPAIVGLIGVLITAIAGLIGAWIGYYFNEQRHKREIGVKMIEISLRDWAANVLNKCAKEAGLPELPQAFQNYRLPITTIFDAATGRYMNMPDTTMGMPETLREEARKAASPT
jgi:hypothetical protein